MRTEGLLQLSICQYASHLTSRAMNRSTNNTTYNYSASDKGRELRRENLQVNEPIALPRDEGSDTGGNLLRL